jgi:FtsP/CotA-like multicopper oxidase with cupredoxin domain
VDFAGLAPGTRLVLRNVAKTPYPAGATPQGTTTGQIVQFTVKATNGSDGTYDPASGRPIRRADESGTIQRPMVKLVNFLAGTANAQPARARHLTLNEVMGMTPWTISTDLYTGSDVTSPLTVTYPGGPLEILLNNTKWDRETTETPTEGETEVWEIVNLTADAHPIHLHLVQFQILNRQAFDAAKYQAAYGALFPSGVYQPGFGPPGPYDPGAVKPVPGVAAPAIPFVGGNPDSTPYLMGPALPPAAQEAGWKDTAQAPPGTVTRLLVRWTPTDVPLDASGEERAFAFDPAANGGGYVWHCHIIDHEDNEMMRRTSISPLVEEETRAYRLGVHY